MSDLERRARVAAEEALAEQGYVAALDVLIGMRWLMQTQVDAWRQGRTSQTLDQAIQVRPEKLAAVVVRFARNRKRYERQGILVEPEALEQARR